MDYQTGEPIQVGDTVTLHGMAGVVVFSIDGDAYTDQFPRAEWSYLAEGVGIMTDEAGLIHVTSNNDLALIARQSG